MNAPVAVPDHGGVALLRAATRAAHERVDAAFGALGLSDAEHYARFLRAHARALPVAERCLGALPFFATIAPRTPLLAADMEMLGLPMPEGLPFAATTDEARLWGILYVVEGSRLGGVMLARDVAESLPRAYLAAAHPPGGWRTIRQRIDAAAAAGDAAWQRRMEEGALACFDLYERAAAAA